MKSFQKGDTVFCEYTNWRGETSIRGFIHLDSLCTSNEFHKDKQLLHIGYDIVKCELRSFADKDMKDIVIVKPYSKRIVTCRRKKKKKSRKDIYYINNVRVGSVNV